MKRSQGDGAMFEGSLPTPALGINGLKLKIVLFQDLIKFASNACFGHKWIETFSILFCHEFPKSLPTPALGINGLKPTMYYVSKSLNQLPTPALGINGLKRNDRSSFDTSTKLPTPALGINGLKHVLGKHQNIGFNYLPTPALGINGLKQSSFCYDITNIALFQRLLWA